MIGAFLLAFALIVYLTSAQAREEEYFNRLYQQGETKANLLFDAKVAPNVLQLIYKRAPNALFQEEVAVYDTSFKLLYHDAVEIDKVKETKSMIDSIVALKQIKLYLNNMQVVGFLYQHNNKQFVVTAAARDGNGLAKLTFLRNTLIITFLVSIILIFLTGRFLAKQSLNPVAGLNERVKKITVTNLDLRVDEGNRKDEIAALAITFNEMLNRLENSFNAQKHFVSNISHELRTPLTAMLAEMQLTVQKERTVEEYKASVNHIMSDTQKLIRLSNSLLDLAKANFDQTEIAFKEIRLDEILLDASNDLLHNQPNYKVNIAFESEIENDNFISIKGNEYLLKVAFINLIENGCKFSINKQCKVAIAYTDRDTVLVFSDNGIGISSEELNNIYKPFYRGANKKFADGNGIGLFLTKKIISLHGGDISVFSRENEGTAFTIKIPHI
jgi:signal transduction histidine kinase